MEALGAALARFSDRFLVPPHLLVSNGVIQAAASLLKKEAIGNTLALAHFVALPLS